MGLRKGVEDTTACLLKVVPRQFVTKHCNFSNILIIQQLGAFLQNQSSTEKNQPELGLCEYFIHKI